MSRTQNLQFARARACGGGVFGRWAVCGGGGNKTMYGDQRKESVRELISELGRKKKTQRGPLSTAADPIPLFGHLTGGAHWSE